MNKPEQTRPRVSIVIPAFNRAHVIERAITSCLSQTLDNIEIIVVDDGSTDNTQEVVRTLMERDGRVSLLVHERNLQAFEARRTGVNAAKADYLLLLDSDDWLDVDVCERVLELAVTDDADIVQFSILPDYEDNPPAQEVVEQRRAMFAARDIDVQGPDITHATYRDNEVVWSLDGKLYETKLMRRAFAELPMCEMFQCEDAYLYFVITTLARHLVGSTSLPLYHYDLRTGDTRTDRLLTAREFEAICAGCRAAKFAREYVRRKGWEERYELDLRELEWRTAADPVNRFPSHIEPKDRLTAWQALIQVCPLPMVINECVETHAGNPELALAGLLELPEFMYRVQNTGPILVVGSALSASMGVLDAVGFDGPSAKESQGRAYASRADALRAAIARYRPSAVLFSPNEAYTLPWDILVVRSQGVDVFVVLSEASDCLLWSSCMGCLMFVDGGISLPLEASSGSSRYLSDRQYARGKLSRFITEAMQDKAKTLQMQTQELPGVRSSVTLRLVHNLAAPLRKLKSFLRG